MGTGILPSLGVEVPHPSMTLSPCSRQAQSTAGSCAGEEEVVTDHHWQGDGSSQMPGQREEAMATALCGNHNGVGRAEGQHPSNNDLVLSTNGTPPPAWPPLCLPPSKEVGKPAAPGLTREQRARRPQSTAWERGPAFTPLLQLSLRLSLGLENHSPEAPEACGLVPPAQPKPASGAGDGCA